MIDWSIWISGIVIGVDLEMEWQAFDTFLGAEVGGQTLDGNVHLKVNAVRLCLAHLDVIKWLL